ncbi:MAG: YcjF family protein [Lacipirellulaceae bacterium]
MIFPRKTSRGLLIVASLAAIGWGLVTVPPRVMSGYESATKAGSFAATAYLALVTLGGAVLLGLALWGGWRLWGATLLTQRRQSRRAKNPSELSRRDRSSELTDNLAASRDHALAASPRLRTEIERAIAELEAKHATKRLEIVAFGTISSGKSSLLNALAGRDAFTSDVVGGTTTERQSVPWPDSDSVVLVDTPGLAEVQGESRAALAAESASEADLVLFVVDGPFKAYEHELLERLAAMEKRLVVCLNKEDWYDRTQREELLGQLREQVPRRIDPRDVVAVRSRGTVRPVVRVSADGVESPGTATVDPDISPLAERLMEIVRSDGGDLLLANLLMQSRGLVDEAKERVLETLDAEADALIDRYTWASAGVAAVNPIPVLDLLGGSAVTIKMVVDLARVYKQPIDADTVVELMAQLGKNLIGMIGVSAAAPAVGAAVASLLKTVPGAGWMAGGLLQGVVQALLTRWIGRVFRAYYRAETRPTAAGLAELARTEWVAATSAAELRKLVRAGRERLAAEAEHAK